LLTIFRDGPTLPKEDLVDDGVLAGGATLSSGGGEMGEVAFACFCMGSGSFADVKTNWAPHSLQNRAPSISECLQFGQVFMILYSPVRGEALITGCRILYAYPLLH